MWAALTEPVELADWLMEVGDYELRVGGPIQFTEEGMGPAGEITVLEPPTLLEYTWTTNDGPESLVRFALAATEEGTELELTHRRLPTHESTLEHMAGWHTHVDWLEAMLTGTEKPDFWTRYHELHASYSAA